MLGIRRYVLCAASKAKALIPVSQEIVRCSSNTVEIPPSTKQQEIPQQYTIPKGILGQPTCHTHPHLILPGYLTCGITQMEYHQRRETLVRKLLSEVQNVNSSQIIVIPASAKKYMSDKIPYVFRQNSDFFYLTGCLEPSAVLVIYKPAETDTFKSIMFVHEKDSHAELWEGPRTGCDAAVDLFAVDEAHPVDTLGTYLRENVTSRSKLWYCLESPADPETDRTVRAASQGLRAADPTRVLHFMRVVKSPAEIELMKETCMIGCQAINMAMACTKPGVSEHQVSSVLDYTCRQAGAEQLSFPPVVAGGPRAAHIHYVANNQLLDHSHMLLVDSGTQRWLYNSDISRTWPVTGEFSKYHKIMYELVLTVQKRLIELVGEQRPSLDQLFDHMCRLLGTHMQEEGILPKNIEGPQLIGKAYRLCPHHVAHYLGLDVHDAPLVRRQLPVASGMVITVEPGLYISPFEDSVPAEFRGVGIRVEDDVLVTDGEPLVLTAAAVKEPDDIEAMVGQHTL